MPLDYETPTPDDREPPQWWILIVLLTIGAAVLVGLFVAYFPR